MPREARQQVVAVLAGRRSVRRYRPECPPRETILELLSAAVTAPSASNRQPWRFTVVTRRDTIDALAAAVRDEVDQLTATLDPSFAAGFESYARSFTAFQAAPVVIAVHYRPVALLGPLLRPTTREAVAAAVDDVERTSAIASAAMALENLLLAAPSLGLGACPMTGPLVARDALSSALGAQAPWELLALVAVGWPDEVPEATPRTPAERVTRWIE